MARRAIDLTMSLVRTFVAEIVRLAKVAVPVMLIAMVVLLIVGSGFGMAFVVGLLAGLVAAAIMLSSAIDSDGDDEWRGLRQRKRPGRIDG